MGCPGIDVNDVAPWQLIRGARFSTHLYIVPGLQVIGCFTGEFWLDLIAITVPDGPTKCARMAE